MYDFSASGYEAKYVKLLVKVSNEFKMEINLVLVKKDNEVVKVHD